MDSKGFSLLELLVIIIIIGILARVAVVQLGKASQYDIHVTAVDQVKQALRAARAEAIARDAYVDFALVDAAKKLFAIRTLNKSGSTYSVNTIIKNNIAIGSAFSRSNITVLFSSNLNQTAGGKPGIVFDRLGRVDNVADATNPTVTINNGSQTSSVTVEIGTGYAH